MTISPPGRLVAVRGTRLHVDVRGHASAPAVLYIHGGPGQGAYDFMQHQGDRLAEHLCVVGLDQRGVLFSEPLAEDARLTEAELVADFEALRAVFGIGRWAILGHSFGARLALRYAVSHPGSVSAVVFDNPTWDHAATGLAMLGAALPVLEDLGASDAVARARVLLDSGLSPGLEGVQQCIQVVDRLGSRKMDIYLHPDTLDRIGDLFPADRLPGDVRSRGRRYADLFFHAPDFSESLLPWLGRLTRPALLIKGRYDPVTSQAEVDAFTHRVADGTLEVFDRAGHFPQFEDPDTYTETITNFVCEHTP